MRIAPFLKGFSRLTLLQEIRRRHRYLAHLPLTCEFSICELALQPPILSKETLDTFSGLKAFACFSAREFTVVDFKDRNWRFAPNRQMSWRRGSAWGRRKWGRRSGERRELKWRRTRSRVNVSTADCRNMSTGQRGVRLTCGTAPSPDPEVHIGLENLQHFPAFGSPPYNSGPPVQLDFTYAPPSPLSSSPSSGESLLLQFAVERSQLNVWALIVPFCLFLDGIRFPVLNGQSSSPTVGSVEDDSHCMSFAQVCMKSTDMMWGADVDAHNVTLTVSRTDAERWESQSGCWAQDHPKAR